MADLLGERAAERVAQGLTVVSFVVLCWVGHRALQVRTHCVNSSFLSAVQIGGLRLDNCRFESRLDLGSLTSPLSYLQQKAVRQLEVLEPLLALFPQPRADLAVDIREDHPKAFQLDPGYLQLGSDWLKDPTQLRRALVMGVLKSKLEQSLASQFQLEVYTDFLILAVFGDDSWSLPGGSQSYSMKKLVRFPTMAPSFDGYCRSPFRSLAHHTACDLPEPDSLDLHAKVWGMRPLLALALWRVLDLLPLESKVRALETFRNPPHLPLVQTVRQADVENLVDWFRNSLKEHVEAFGLPPSDEEVSKALKRTLKELQVEAPTRWELTVDLTHTPVWEEILRQLKVRSRFHTEERTLVFTPDGSYTLPSGLPVAWNTEDIRSQKHVMIACEWPSPEEAVHVRARHMYARQSCEKLTRPFWD